MMSVLIHSLSYLGETKSLDDMDKAIQKGIAAHRHDRD